MPLSPKSKQINITLGDADSELFRVIVDRSAARGPRYRPASFVTDVLRWWHSQGAPPVSAQDHWAMLGKQMAGKYPETQPQRFGTNEGKK